MTGRRAALACTMVACLLALGGCQQGGADGYGVSSGNGEISPVAGALGGAGLGALAGRLIAGKHDNSVAMLGGALIGGLGGLLGTQAYDRSKAQQNENQELSQQLSFSRSQLAQQEALNQNLQSQALYDQWGETQGHATAVNAPAEVTTAQRMLTVLGLYTGPIDGQNGPQTSVAIAQFQKSRGLPTTGNVTPSLIQMLNVAI
jgi:Putative peptidoglycan binding domain